MLRKVKKYLYMKDKNTRIRPTINIKSRDKLNDLDQVWLNNSALKIILFLMKNNKSYYTREEIAKNTFITISALERYLPKLANSKYNLIKQRLTSGNSNRANHVKEYHINEANTIIQALYKIVKEIQKYKINNKIT